MEFGFRYLSYFCILFFGIIFTVLEQARGLNSLDQSVSETHRRALEWYWSIATLSFLLLLNKWVSPIVENWFVEHINQSNSAFGLSHILRFVLALLVCDLIFYLLHRLKHASLAMWNTHRWHHIVTHVNWGVFGRRSIIEFFLGLGYQAVICFYVFNLSKFDFALISAIANLSLMFSHLNLDFGNPTLEKFIVTPNFHRVHHFELSAGLLQSGGNFAGIFSFFDHLFGTYVDPRKVGLQKMGIGRDGLNKKPWEMLIGV